MLEIILSWSIAHRRLVLALAGALAVAGVLAFARLPIDAFPDTTPVQVHVNTTAPALAPIDVERQITTQVEQAISGLPALHEVRSISKFGLSQITAVFADGTDIQRARQAVMERLQEVELPAGIERPRLGPIATGLGEVFHYIVTGTGRSLAELRTVHDWVVRPQLRSVPGVAEVNAWGGDERQLQVVVDPAVLAAHGLTLGGLIEALERNNAAVGGGVIEGAGQSSLVQGIGVVTRPSDIADIVVATRNGIPTHVHDVARVVDGRSIRHGAVTADGRGEVVLGLGFMLLGENSHDVTRRLAARLEEVRKSLPAGIEAVPLYDRTDLIDHVLETVRTNLLEGALLVVAVLFVFLGNLRAGLIVASAIPLSMLFAFDLMLRAGIAGSLMSLGAIDFGLIVDSAVIQVENAAHRLAGGGGAPPGRDGPAGVEQVRQAAIEVRRPTMFGELIILVVYLPILALEGVEGKMFRPMALTVMFALLGSLLLSLTVVPALCATFLPGARLSRRNRVVEALDRVYRPGLAFALRRRGAVLAAAALLVAGAALLAPRLGSVFVPRLSEGAVVINCVRLAGISLDESVRHGTRIERTLLERFPDEIDRIWTRTGTAEVATDPMGVELSDVFITLRPRSEWKRARTQDGLVRAMEETLSGLPGMRTIFTQPIEMRMNELVAGVRSDVAVKLFGDDFAVLRARAREIEPLMSGIPGAADVVTEQLTGQPVLQVEVDRAAIARSGIAARDALDAVEALGGREVGVLHEGDRRFPIAVLLEDRYRTDAAAVGRIPVSSEAGDRVPLVSLARIRATEGPSTINREWGRRRIVVQGNVRGRDVGSFVVELRREIDRRIALPPGYYVRYGGQFEHLERAQRRLLIVVPLALALIAGLLYLSFRSRVDAALVFTAVPFAMVGGVGALWLRGLPFSISAAVGFIALCGVAVLNGLVLVTSIRQERAGGVAPVEAIERAARRRLRPVLMTALVASLGFVPMALNSGIGAEVQRPLATVVIGGVLSSTLLTLFVLPALVSLLDERARRPRGGAAGV